MGKSEADVAWEKLLRACGHAVVALSRDSGDGALGSVKLTEVRFKLDADDGTSVLGILKGVAAEGRVITFVGGPDLPSVVLAIGKKIRADVLRWREDRPFGM